MDLHKALEFPRQSYFFYKILLTAASPFSPLISPLSRNHTRLCDFTVTIQKGKTTTTEPEVISEKNS